MSVWREVQEAIYQRFADQWASTTPYCFADEGFDPPAAAWCRLSVIRLPGGAGTLGKPGNRKMDRRGLLMIQLFEPPGNGVGPSSDLAEQAAGVFENQRIATHDIRFADVEPGTAAEEDGGRWWMTIVEGAFDYEQLV